MYKLTFLDASRPSHWLIDEVTSIGSHLRNTLVVNVEGMADTHAILSKNNDSYFISPVKGCSVKVNDSLIRHEYPLQRDDMIELGSQQLRFIYVPSSSKNAVLSDSHFVATPARYWQVDFISATEGKSVHITESISIGRDVKSGFVLNDPDVSRTHAKLLLSPSFGLSIQDLNSANGTLLNGKPVKQSRLELGDRITIAKKYHFVVVSLVGEERIDNPTTVEAASDATRYQPAINDAPSRAEADTAMDAYASINAHTESLGLVEITDSAFVSTTQRFTTKLRSISMDGSGTNVISVLSFFVLLLGVLGVILLFAS